MCAGNRVRYLLRNVSLGLHRIPELDLEAQRGREPCLGLPVQWWLSQTQNLVWERPRVCLSPISYWL